jgi:hypothetical protein
MRCLGPSSAAAFSEDITSAAAFSEEITSAVACGMDTTSAVAFGMDTTSAAAFGNTIVASCKLIMAVVEAEGGSDFVCKRVNISD